jgi:hypothetical protein
MHKNHPVDWWKSGVAQVISYTVTVKTGMLVVLSKNEVAQVPAHFFSKYTAKSVHICLHFRDFCVKMRQLQSFYF